MAVCTTAIVFAQLANETAHTSMTDPLKQHISPPRHHSQHTYVCFKLALKMLHFLSASWMVKCVELQEISFKTATFSLSLMAKCVE